MARRAKVTFSKKPLGTPNNSLCHHFILFFSCYFALTTHNVDNRQQQIALSVLNQGNIFTITLG